MSFLWWTALCCRWKRVCICVTGTRSIYWRSYFDLFEETYLANRRTDTRRVSRYLCISDETRTDPARQTSRTGSIFETMKAIWSDREVVTSFSSTYRPKLYDQIRMNSGSEWQSSLLWWWDISGGDWRYEIIVLITFISKKPALHRSFFYSAEKSHSLSWCSSSSFSDDSAIFFAFSSALRCSL